MAFSLTIQIIGLNKMKLFKKYNLPQQGFTLVELMIAVAIASIVMAVVAITFTSQEKSYSAQDQIVEMQQNLRAGMDLMTREIRMASYTPVLDNVNDLSGGLQANFAVNSLTFINEIDTAGTLQTVQYLMFDYYNNDDPALLDLCRQVDGGTSFPIVENVEAIEFRYLYFDPNQTFNGQPSDIPIETTDQEKVELVQISMLVRAERQEPGFVNTLEYFPASCPQQPGAPDYSCIEGIGSPWDLNPGTANSIAPNDDFRRRLLVVNVNLRN
ncbi:MAG: prepilin-type N-terminal cleavage/methylation domain-containing protein [Proteobacteria bacterium]|nr:prepilin-type N-terminal cleavage/methylation domain-containing protein [Pseudomonadota bacterium]MBU1716390.1 prepilin-type N-terminal cleavage/methylation domain-containing protein [Pseudomonadota bacterium]